MACPKCGCKCTYPYDDSDDDAMQGSDGLERCAACGDVFQLDDELPEDEDVETRIQELLARRRAMNVSGQAGEDIQNIREAFNANPNDDGKLTPQGAQRLEGTEKRSFLASA